MSERIRYQVLPDPEEQGAWIVEVDGVPGPGNFKDKTLAVGTATEAAKARWQESGTLTQVLIHGNDGKIQDERTYGNDPKGTPG